MYNLAHTGWYAICLPPWKVVSPKRRRSRYRCMVYRCMVIVTRRRIWHCICHQHKLAHHHHRKPRRNVRGVLYMATQDSSSRPDHPRRSLHITSQGNNRTSPPPGPHTVHTSSPDLLGPRRAGQHELTGNLSPYPYDAQSESQSRYSL